MVTKEYIDGTPSIQTLIAKLAKIPGVIGAWADVMTDPVLIEKAHPESIMLYVKVPPFRKTPTFSGVFVNIDPTVIVENQILGFAMPPEAYSNVEGGHTGIINAMTSYVNSYFATGNARVSTGEEVPVQVPKTVATPIPETPPTAV